MPAEIWPQGNPDRQLAPRDVWQALGRGLRCKCPACGKGALFSAYIKPVLACKACGEDLSHQRADDAPPYFTILIAGHIVVPLLLVTEINYAPPLWFEMPFWVLLALGLTLALLQPVKGAVIAWQWAMYMHGFDPRGADAAADAAAVIHSGGSV